MPWLPCGPTWGRIGCEHRPVSTDLGSVPRELDARNERCPLPIIRLAALLADLPPGEEVVLFATDPAARSDVPAFCRMRGHELVAVEDRPAGDDQAGPAHPAHPAYTAYTAYRVRRG